MFDRFSISNRNSSMFKFNNFHPSINVAVVGATGGLGQAFIETLLDIEQVASVTAFSRCSPIAEGDAAVLPCFNHHKLRHCYVDLSNNASIAEMGIQCEAPLDLVIVASGLLHSEVIKPEKTAVI